MTYANCRREVRRAVYDESLRNSEWYHAALGVPCRYLDHTIGLSWWRG